PKAGKPIPSRRPNTREGRAVSLAPRNASTRGQAGDSATKFLALPTEDGAFSDMLFAQKSAADKRADFRTALRAGRLLRLPGAVSPLVALLIERQGFEGVYVSGAALSADLALPDVGLTTLTEVAQRGRAIARVTALPALIDADTGFGEAMNAARTVQELEELGLCGCHIGDQVNPDSCGRL